MLQSIEQVSPGDWLVCSLGPKVYRESKSKEEYMRDRAFVGTLVYVLAVSPPCLLLRIYPMPCGDPRHNHTPVVMSLEWLHAGWDKANKKYIREYMKYSQRQPLKSLPGRRSTTTLSPSLAVVLDQLEKRKEG